MSYGSKVMIDDVAAPELFGRKFSKALRGMDFNFKIPLGCYTDASVKDTVASTKPF